MPGRRNGGTWERGKVKKVVVERTLRTFLTFLRRIAGMPDYDAHVAHLRRFHPEHPIPSQREFYDEFTRTRYGEGPTRCC
jgi:uncharacterized short protein YbdD (DUF466 family)